MGLDLNPSYGPLMNQGTRMAVTWLNKISHRLPSSISVLRLYVSKMGPLLALLQPVHRTHAYGHAVRTSEVQEASDSDM